MTATGRRYSTCVDCTRNIVNTPAAIRTESHPGGWRRVVGPLCQQCYQEALRYDPSKPREETTPGVCPGE